MPSQVEIVNVSLTLLGEDRIASIDDDVKAAREAKALWNVVRDSMLAAHNWNFAKTRAQLSAEVDEPAFGYDQQFLMPSGCLRLIQVGDYHVGLDLTDYRGSSVAEFEIEGRKILTDLSAPLNVRYVQRVTDTTQWHACFVDAMAGELAARLTEPLSQSGSKREAAEKFRDRALSLAVRSNAIELPPQKMADDEWIMSRL